MENVKLDLIPGRVLPICHASQYDVGRVIRFNLVENDVPYVLDGTETVTFDERKIDGNVVTAACVVTANKSYVDVETTEQMCACYGQNLCELKIEKGDVLIGSLNFVLDVERDPLEGGIQSESEIYNLQVQVTAMANAAVAEAMSGYDIYGAYVTEQTSGALANFTDGASNVPVKALSVEFAASQASGTPTPSSPLPITPVNSIAVTRTGINLWDEQWESGGVRSTDGTPTTDANRVRSKNPIAVKSGETFYFKAPASLTLYFYKSDGTYINNTPLAANRAYQIPSGVSTLKFVMGSSTAPVTSITTGDVSINYPSTDTDYHAYNGVTKTLNLGGDYYGGEVDALSGEITDNYGLETINPDNLGMSVDIFTYPLASMKSGNSQNGLCNRFAVVTSSGSFGVRFGANNSTIYFYKLKENIPEITDLATAKTWFTNNPVTVVYPLATPATAQASNAIELNTLYGDNNIFSDAGDVDVTYRADTALYIDKRLNA